MNTPTIAIIGAGHMGSSIIGGLIKQGHPCQQLWASSPNEAKLTRLQNAFSIHITTDNTLAIQQADVIIFALKPQTCKKAISSLAPAMTHAKSPLIISVVAGIREHCLARWLGNPTMPIIRAMPNTPALIGCGVTALYANAHVSKEQRQVADTILNAVGITTWLTTEHLLDTVTALSGSGPAYFFLIMEAMQLAAEQLGLESATARLLTLQTALGAARMAIESDQSLVELRRQVTSPGGTTEKALAVLEKNNLREILKAAVQAAKIHSEELAKLAEEDTP